MTRRRLVRGSALLSIVLPAIVLTWPAPPARPAALTGKPLFAGSPMDDATRALFQRGCQNCHSENHHWPWYSRLPPASLLIQRDVESAQQHFNASRWDSYAPERQRDLLARMGSLARSGQMPPRRYRWLHREAALTPAERQQLYAWTRLQRKRLAHAGSPLLTGASD